MKVLNRKVRCNEADDVDWLVPDLIYPQGTMRLEEGVLGKQGNHIPNIFLKD